MAYLFLLIPPLQYQQREEILLWQTHGAVGPDPVCCPAPFSSGGASCFMGSVSVAEQHGPCELQGWDGIWKTTLRSRINLRPVYYDRMLFRNESHASGVMELKLRHWFLSKIKVWTSEVYLVQMLTGICLSCVVHLWLPLLVLYFLLFIFHPLWKVNIQTV